MAAVEDCSSSTVVHGHGGMNKMAVAIAQQNSQNSDPVLSSSDPTNRNNIYMDNTLTTTRSSFASPGQKTPELGRQIGFGVKSHEISYPRAKLLLKEEEIAMLNQQCYRYGSEELGLNSVKEQERSYTYSWETGNDRPLLSPALSDASSVPKSTRDTGTLGVDGRRTLKRLETSPQRSGSGSRPARKRKISGGKADKPKVPKLTKPLSELTKDYHNLPFKNMENWVHRSAEVRWAEVDKRGGYVTRPMNSFMLYRSAYAERTKFWCLQNNHQVVSSVSGESWPLEPPHIREKYNELAKIERMNHQAAHPGYKFSPSKAQTGRKRKDPKSITEEEFVISDLDDNLEFLDSTLDHHKSKKNSRSKRGLVRIGSGGNPLLCVGFSYDKPTGGPIRSSFNHNNPGKVPPQCMGTSDMLGHYYETTVRASSATPIQNPISLAVIEDVTIRKTLGPTNVMHSQFTHDPQNGIPSGNQYSPRLNTIKSEPEDNSKVDPILLSQVNSNNNTSHISGSPMQDYSNLLGRQFISCGNNSCGLSGYELDPLFGGSLNVPYLEVPFLDTGNQDSFIQFESSLLGSNIDVHKLPGYSENMEGFLDNQEPWSVTEDLATPDDDEKLCYDEWLQC